MSKAEKELQAAHERIKHLEKELQLANTELARCREAQWMEFATAIQSDKLSEAQLDQEFSASIRDTLDLVVNGNSLFHVACRYASNTADVVIPWLLRHRSDKTLPPLNGDIREIKSLECVIAAKNWKALEALYSELTNEMLIHYQKKLFEAMLTDFPGSQNHLITFCKTKNPIVEGLTPLQYACVQKNVALATCLITNSACSLSSVGLQTFPEKNKNFAPGHKPPLWLACEIGLVDVVSNLFNRDPQLNTQFLLHVTRKERVMNLNGYDVEVTIPEQQTFTAWNIAINHKQWLCIPLLITRTEGQKSCDALKILSVKYQEVFEDRKYADENPTQQLIRIVQSCALEFFYLTRNDNDKYFSRKHERAAVAALLTRLYAMLDQPTAEVIEQIKVFLTPDKIDTTSFKYLLMIALLNNNDFCQTINKQEIEQAKPQSWYDQFITQCQKTRKTNPDFVVL